MPRRYAMSSVHKQEGKPNWFCAFYDPEGFRKFKSTGTDNRKVASKICSALEHAATLAKQKELQGGGRDSAAPHIANCEYYSMDGLIIFLL